MRWSKVWPATTRTGPRLQRSAALASILLIALLLVPITLTFRQWREIQLNQDLILSIKHSDLRAVRADLKSGANPNALFNDDPPPSFWQTLCNIALRRHNYESDKDQGTLLLLATMADKDQPEIVEALLQAGANPNHGGMRGLSPLTATLVYSHYASMTALLNHGANASEQLLYNEPLLVLADEDVEAVQILLDHHANPNALDISNGTPLMHAVDDGNAAIVALLISHHADVNAVDKGGNTAMSIAKRIHRTDLVALLRKAGATQ